MATGRKSSSSYGGFADGVIIRGMPLLTLYPGDVYWVDSNGGGGPKGTFRNPSLTLAAAHALVTSDNGDIIAVKPGHAETYTATVDFSKSGFAILGLGFGDNRPTITQGITASGDDMLDFAGDDVLVYNLKFKEAAPAGDTGVWINCSGDYFHIEGCYIELGAKSLVAITHDTTAKKGLTVLNNTFVGTAAGPNNCVVIEKTHLYADISKNKFLFGESAGCDDGIIVHTSGTTNDGDHIVNDNIVIGLANAEKFLVQTDIMKGVAINNLLVSADATDALGDTSASGMAFFWNMSTEPGKGQPPAVDIQGSRPLDTTAAE